MNDSTRANTIIWNNKDILINGTSIFHYSLFNKGIILLEDLASDKNDVIIKQNLNKSIFTPMEVFYLMQILDALPMAIVAKFLVVLWAKKLEIFYFK